MLEQTAVRSTTRETLACAFISSVIAGMLGLQAFAVIDPLVPRWFPENGYFWPFVDYPMYREAGIASQSIDRFVAVGTLADKTEVRIDHSDLKLTPFQYQTGFVEAILRHDVLAIRTYLQTFETAPDAVIRVRLEKNEVSLTSAGGQGGPARIVTTVMLRGPRS